MVPHQLNQLSGNCQSQSGPLMPVAHRMIQLDKRLKQPAPGMLRDAYAGIRYGKVQFDLSFLLFQEETLTVTPPL